MKTKALPNLWSFNFAIAAALRAVALLLFFTCPHVRPRPATPHCLHFIKRIKKAGNPISRLPLPDLTPPMTTMAYPGYDGFGRSISRRQSVAYSTNPISYSPRGVYTDPMMHRSFGEVSDCGLEYFVIL